MDEHGCGNRGYELPDIHRDLLLLKITQRVTLISTMESQVPRTQLPELVTSI